MHVAAKSKNAEIAELILSTVSNTEFIKLLYGDDNQQNAEDRTSVLLDLYLNTPNKGLNETPLHFASKHGAADVVEILVSYPQCDKSLKNKYNKSADQVSFLFMIVPWFIHSNIGVQFVSIIIVYYIFNKKMLSTWCSIYFSKR